MECNPKQKGGGGDGLLCIAKQMKKTMASSEMEMFSSCNWQFIQFFNTSSKTSIKIKQQ